MSVSPLIARQIPIWDGEKVSGFVDLALEYAFKYRPGKESERIEIPPTFRSARSKRAPTCSNSSPTMTTSCSSNC